MQESLEQKSCKPLCCFAPLLLVCLEDTGIKIGQGFVCLTIY